MFTQLNQYRVVLEVMPEFQNGPQALQFLDIRSLTGGQVPLNVFTQFTETTTPLVISRQGQFPAVTLSFNLAPGNSLGDAVDGDRAGRATRSVCRPASAEVFKGTAQAFQASLGKRNVADSRGAGDRLHRARHSVRELYPSAHDSLHAALRRRRRAAGVDAVPRRNSA